MEIPTREAWKYEKEWKIEDRNSDAAHLRTALEVLGSEIEAVARGAFALVQCPGLGYSIAVGTTDQLMDVIPGSMERRDAIFSISSFWLP